MKSYFVSYYLKGQSKLFSEPQKVIAKNFEELMEILKKIHDYGYTLVKVSEITEYM